MVVEQGVAEWEAAVCVTMVKVSWCCMVQSCTRLELLVKVSTP